MTEHIFGDDFKNIVNTLVRFSLPLILSGILQQLYNWVDAFIVGNVEGELALAAVGATGTVINFYIMAITGFTLGLAILFGQKFGSGELDYIPKVLSTFTVILGASFIILSLLGALTTVPLLELLHTTGDTIHMAADYLQIIFAGIPFMAVYNVYSAAMRGTGDSKAPFLAILVSSIVNIVLDIIFVALWGWGVRGAAAATVLSQISMAVFIIIYASSKYRSLRFSFREKLVDKGCLVQGFNFGLPPMIQSSITAFGSIILQNFMNGFGTQTVAAITTAYRIDTMALLPIINLGSGISTIVAQNYGAGKIRQTRKIFFVGTALMVIVSVMLTALIVLAGGSLISLFGASEAAIDIGRNFFYRLASFYLVFGIATAMRGYIEGLGDVVYSSVAGIVSLAVRIILSYGLVSFFGNMVIAYAEAFAWILLLIMYGIRVFVKHPG